MCKVMEKKEKNCNSYSELPEGVEEVKVATKKEFRKGKESSRILKKGKSIKEKNDPERFSGEGITFRAKIIGIEDVFDARGNLMCQEALQKLKAAVKTSGDHKQRILLNISLDGIIIKNEKSGEVLHHHPIHKISCISQDTKDSRAFGFVYGCPQTGHRFFAIKTEKAASQVVVTLRDLFLVALEMKKKEIEKTQKEEQENKREKEVIHNGLSNGNTVSSDFATSSVENNKEYQRISCDLLYSNTVLLPKEVPLEKDLTEPEVSLDELLDLQSEVSILQQGISQMDQTIAHTVSQSLGFSLSEDEISESSVSSVPTSFPFKLSSLYHETMSTSSRSSSTSDYNVGAAENRQDEGGATPKKVGTAPGTTSLSADCNSNASEATTGEDKYAVFLDIDSLPSIFDNPAIVKIPKENATATDIRLTGGSVSDVGLKDTTCESQQDDSIQEACSCIEDPEVQFSSTPVPFSELDPLGNQPYVDRRDFFQEIKNPPKKVLKDLVGASNVFCSSLDSFSNSHECLTAFNNSKFYCSESSESSVPLKKAPTVSGNVLELNTSSELLENGWEPKNPFNPFLLEDDILPPPPPPRLPSKAFSEAGPPCCMSPPPPPRPPNRANSAVPTPPLPRRKVPLSSAHRTWFSFDQDAMVLSASPLAAPFFFPADTDNCTRNDVNAPPLPSPARKLPPKPESPFLSKSFSASNSPATLRRIQCKNSLAGNAVAIKENGDNQSVENSDDSNSLTALKRLYGKENQCIENGVVSGENRTVGSPRKVLVRYCSETQGVKNSFSETSIVFQKSGDCSDMKNSENKTKSSPCKLLLQNTSTAIEAESNSSTFPPFNPFLESQPIGSDSPPLLPPKPASQHPTKYISGSFSVPKPVCQPRHPALSSASSSNISAAESSNGTHSSSSLVFSSCSENNVFGTSSEAPLFSSSSADSQSQVFASSQQDASQSQTTTEDDLSPDSIFQRKSDPFADDFFLSVHKKSATQESSNGLKVPT